MFRRLAMEDRDNRPGNQIDCDRFELLISDYLDHEIARSLRRPFGEHLLACSSCHRLFNEVRAVIEACRQVVRLAPALQLPEEQRVEERIVEATSAGTMLNCPTLDQLIFDFFMQEREREDLEEEDLEEMDRSTLPASIAEPRPFLSFPSADRLPEPIHQVAQSFEAHFALCGSCRRLVEGVRQSLEVTPEAVVSDQLYGRILAATVGGR